MSRIKQSINQSIANQLTLGLSERIPPDHSTRQAVGVLYPDLSGAPISEEIMQNYEYNAQET